jgi:mono/diheme cytochrome c family protein
MTSTPVLVLSAFAFLACAPAAAPRLANPPASPAPDARLVAQGDSLFNNGACVRCHGRGGIGGNNGPSLVTGPWLHADGSLPALSRVITSGVPRDSIRDASRRFAMNPRGGPMNLTDTQVSAVAAYVWSISRAKLPGGRG